MGKNVSKCRAIRIDDLLRKQITISNENAIKRIRTSSNKILFSRSRLGTINQKPYLCERKKNWIFFQLYLVFSINLHFALISLFNHNQTIFTICTCQNLILKSFASLSFCANKFTYFITTRVLNILTVRWMWLANGIKSSVNETENVENLRSKAELLNNFQLNISLRNLAKH